ncbi:hypothetical protein UMAG_05243 [Mycosarcoma maydis]|uniref:Uncharacterized protein n=1 Tax=Mycosarcoma maydis TaxID=5270 RepID=A0A0D1CUR6_MYCMD|nr:hypothetical protein UMAG_05243 [Ustilago maydis 521]|eukprot:XP_011388276.1 hypothetical protein UMAG_05243 [Ustilago maydis 521]
MSGEKSLADDLNGKGVLSALALAIVIRDGAFSLFARCEFRQGVVEVDRDRIGAVCDRRRCGDRDRESEISDGDATRHEPCHPSIDRSRVWDPGPGSLWTMVETSSQRSGVDLDLDHHHHRAPGTGHRGGFWRLDLGGAFFETKKSGKDDTLFAALHRECFKHPMYKEVCASTITLKFDDLAQALCNYQTLYSL